MASLPLSSIPTPLPPRALASLSSHLSTEVLLLARIHYKNQSQHRLSLFWRRVDEVKHLGDKVQAVWVAWEAKSKEPEVSIDGKKGAKVKGGREVELRKLGTLLEKLHLSLPKLQVSLHQLVLLTHFLPLVTVLLGMTARLWGLSAGLYDHLRGIWSRDFPEKRPWKELDGGAKLQEEEEEVVSTTTRTSAALPPTRAQGLTSASVSRTPTPAPTPPPPTLASEYIPTEHGEVIQRQPPPAPPSPLALGTLIPRQPSSLFPKPTLPPSNLQDEPITYADSDSDSFQPEAPPPPQPKPKPVPTPVLVVAPPPLPPMIPSAVPKPLKRPTTSTSISSPSLAKRPKVDPSLPSTKVRKVDATTTMEGKKQSETVEKKVKKVIKTKKKVRRDEMDDIFG